MASSAQDDKQRQILIFQPHRLGGGIGALVHGDRLLSKLVLHEHDGGKRDGQQIASQLTPYYHAVKAADKIGLLQRTFEDGSFGADTTMVDGVNVSRDLLDSVSEMLFLHKAFLYRPGGLDTLSVLDVGGGYGRLTKRWRDAWPKGRYHVTDGMAVSTYLAKKYLGHYHYGRSVVPLTEVHG